MRDTAAQMRHRRCRTGLPWPTREQLAREIAAIERATASLRRAEPAPAILDQPPPATASQQTRPLWLLIGALWLSTALVTLSAVFAIIALVG